MLRLIELCFFQYKNKKDGQDSVGILSIGQGSKGIAELLEKSFAEFSLEHQLNFPKNIENRDVGDIPNYWFRDDGLNHWKIMMEYVQDVIDLFYESDDDVVEDCEVHEWIHEVIE